MLKRICLYLKKSEQGFSMLELLVYVGIVGVIVSFAVPRYTNAMTMANTAKIQSDLQTLDAAITMYQLQNGTDPTSITTDLAEYIQHVDKLKPPTGSYILKNGTIEEISATEYVIMTDGDEAGLQNHTLDEFGKGDTAEKS